MRIRHWLICLLLFVQLANAANTQHIPKIRVVGTGFVTADGKPFVPFGVSYYRPGTGWAPQLWKKFDAEATRRDFARMKELGVNCVRVFLTYGSFYREPGILDTNGLARFDQFLAIAEDAGIYVHPTGPELWEGPPDWPVSVSGKEELKARELFWQLFARRYRGRNIIFAYDLANEPAVGWENLGDDWHNWLRKKYHSIDQLNVAWPAAAMAQDFGAIPVPGRKDALNDARLLDFQAFRESLADDWTRRQRDAIKSADPHALVTVGLVQWSVPSLLPGTVAYYSGFRPKRLARYLDFMEIHFYPLADGGYKYRDSASELRNLAYLESVVRETAQKHKPLVLAEFGWYGGDKAPTFNGGQFPQATEDQQADYDRHVIQTTAGLACGWLNWGFYDQPEAGDCSQQTGLLTADGKLKAWGRTFHELAISYEGKTFRPGKIGPRPAMDWDACLSCIASEKQFLDDYCHAFMLNH